MNEPVSFPVFVVMRNGHIMPPGIHLHRANAEATAAREEGAVVPLVASPPAAQPNQDALPFMPTTDAAKPTEHMVDEALDGFNTMPATEGLRAQVEHAVERAMWACPVFAPPSKSVWAMVDKWREESGEDGLHYVLKNALLNNAIELDEALLDAAAQEQKPGLFPLTVNDYHVSAFLFAGLDEITAINVGRFAKSLANKLLAAKAKYGYTDGWAQGGWEDECRAALLHHIEKGDPLDVAAFAMFMWKHEWSTASPIPASGWVKCSDEDFESYPESEKMVLVSIGNSVRLGYKQVCRHPWNKRWKIFGYGTDRSDSVDHWMLLPVAPGETK